MKSILLAISSFALASCSFSNIQEYRLTNANKDDERRVASILKLVAHRTDLIDQTKRSLAKDTIVFYHEIGIQQWAVELGARRDHNNIRVDILAGYGPYIPKYNQVKLILEEEMKEEFGKRFEKIPLSESQSWKREQATSSNGG
jgi:hypothetical protein